MTTLEDVKYFLNITDNSQDDFLRKLIDMTTAKINNLCKRNISYSRLYEVISGEGDDVIWLKNYPVEKVEYIRYREDSGNFDNDLFGGKPIDENVYLDQLSGKLILLNGYALPNGNSNVKIKYFAGYAESAPDPVNELPLDLKWASLMMTSESYLKSFQSSGTENFSKRLGLERFDTLIKKDGSETKYSFTFRDEDYTSILSKYYSIKI